MATALIITLLVLDIFIGGSFGQSTLCQIPKNPNNGQVNCVKDDSNVLKCYATCNSGFTFPHTSVEFRTCNQRDGTWPTGQTFPDCIESVSKCQSLTPPKNGVVKCEKPDGNLICTAKCDKQYIFPSGQSTIKQVCNATTGWQTENELPNCIASCNTQYLISGNPTIKDSDFKVSSTMSDSGKSFNPKKSDIYCTNDCGWRPTSSNLNQFVQINLLKARRLLGIVTKGLTLGSSELFVTRFRILHSIDGKTFVPYSDRNVTDKFFSGNSDGSTTRLNIFSCPFQAQYIIVNPLEWNNGIGLRFDLLGCDIKTFPITTPSPITDKTTSNPPTPSSSGTTLHPFQACSAILPPANGAVNCQKTNNVLSCTALCNDGFQFATSQLLVRLTCQIQTGQWDGNKVFPACIAIHHVSSTTQPPFTHKCIRTQSDCNRFGNGDFQTCGDCRYFATCSEGIVYIRPCPNNLVFDSNTKTCQFHSATCHSLNPFG